MASPRPWAEGMKMAPGDWEWATHVVNVFDAVVDALDKACTIIRDYELPLTGERRGPLGEPLSFTESDELKALRSVLDRARKEG